ncbi:2-ketoacid ferredoxin oxidoreductase alpha subunit [Pyrobaculum aerophilum str. IM2]|uniref:2-oxoacid oxidoreductase (ferredoxin) n=1 Tax=Pyrobaculum aerophilum (strain ATCC 51768 / DSM 7523 / JCM 9630 / CIP 104966 / NBRC 100827 / IM2) TaxID=178306 RepID=Q8ZTF6_PYRAE|nr:pyruvate ferredoxin oxidoreductase [Pyrobaculum aerophilum]AAL64805.1 2-ketoacid ferredoxin oxidoreductase alpha subunit [Pyrobaculum aerophilum str. IM2]
MKTLAVQKTALTGNYAVAYAVKMAKPHVIAAYPITPQTSIVEKLSEFVEKGELNARFVNVESEFAGMSVVYGAAMAGARAFTATSSHGLLYMYEATWWAALSRAPVVMAVVTRTIGPPWNIHVEHNDILVLRDSGWIIAMAENVQEVFDLTLQAFKIAETAVLPMAVGLDGFVLSHSTEPVEIPPQEAVDKFLPPRRPDVPLLLRPGEPVVFGNLPSDNRIHARHKIATVYEAQREAKKVIDQVDWEYGKIIGRNYGGLVEWYKASDAKNIVVCMGAWCSDAKQAVDALRKRSIPVGLMRVRFLRPFPLEEVSQLDQYEKVIVYDRDITPLGGVLGIEIKAALSKASVINIVAGIAGVDFDVQNFYETIQKAIEGSYKGIEFAI